MYSYTFLLLYFFVVVFVDLQGGPAKVKPTYFTHQNAQTCYYSTVLFDKKQVVIRKNIINTKANKYQQNQTILPWILLTSRKRKIIGLCEVSKIREA